MRKERLIIQNITHAIDLLEDTVKELKLERVLGDRINEFYQYVIGKSLFKSGGYNVIYQDNRFFDIVEGCIVRYLMNQPGHRFIYNAILEGMIIPKTFDDEMLDLNLRGCLLFVYSL